MANFGELKAQLRRSVKNPTVEELTDIDAGSYVNSGYMDVSSRYPYHQTRKRCTFDTVIGEERYQMPSDLMAILRLSNITLGRKIWKAGDRLVADRLTDGFRRDPRRYVRYRDYVELVPTPDAVYTVEIFYLAIQALLSADIDLPVVPLTWHNGIWMRAKWYYFIDRGDLSQQQQADAAYKLWLSDKPGEIEIESVDQDTGVELPELGRMGAGVVSRMFDDGYFDYRDA